MNKILTYLFIFGLAGCFIGSAYAGTDMLANALTQSNSFLKEAGLVQKKYSGIARKIVTTKVGIPDNLGSEKAEKYREKAESLKEQAEKTQDRLETAKERKEELAAKYNELNSKAMEYKAKADKAMAEGAAIKEKYQTYKSKAEDALAEAQEMKNKAEDFKEQAKSAVDDAKGLKDAAAAKAGLPVAENEEENNSAALDDNNENAIAETSAVPQLADAEFTEGEITDAAELDTAVETPAPNVIRLPEAALPAYNQADAIRSAAVLADSVSAENTEMTVSDILPDMESLEQPQISASDVMAAAEKVVPAAEKELPSQFNLEEQLLQSSNRVAGPVKDKAAAKEASVADIVKAEDKTVTRNKFSRQAAAIGENGKVMPDTSLRKIIKEKTDVEKL